MSSFFAGGGNYLDAVYQGVASPRRALSCARMAEGLLSGNSLQTGPRCLCLEGKGIPPAWGRNDLLPACYSGFRTWSPGTPLCPKCHRIWIPCLCVNVQLSYPDLHSMTLSQRPICHFLFLVSKVGYKLPKVTPSNSIVALKVATPSAFISVGRSRA